MNDKTYIFLFSLLGVSAFVVLTIFNKIDFAVLTNPYWAPLINLAIAIILIATIFGVIFYIIKNVSKW
jgi:hypothetical protein